MPNLKILEHEQVVCDRDDTAQFIASGGFADIFRGSIDGSIPVAVKYAKPVGKVSALDSEAKECVDKHYESLLKEATIMWNMAASPNVTKVYGVQNDPVSLVCNVLVMELAVCTLNEVLFIAGSNHARFPLPSIGCITTLLLDCAKGIDFLHTNNVVHNDIKPDNMLIYASGVLKLTDFGLATDASDVLPHNTDLAHHAHHVNHHTNHHKKHAHTDKDTDLDVETVAIAAPAVLCKGNAIYQAPEMFIAPPRCTSASDVYAFGIVLNEVLTGQRPSNHMLATMLPLQICGGIRPTPVFGDEVAHSQAGATRSADGNDGNTDSGGSASGDRDTQDALRVLQTRHQECSEETIKRFRHLIHTCWEEIPKARPHSNAVVSVLNKLLDGVGGEQREEIINYIIK